MWIYHTQNLDKKKVRKIKEKIEIFNILKATEKEIKSVLAGTCVRNVRNVCLICVDSILPFSWSVVNCRALRRWDNVGLRASAQLGSEGTGWYRLSQDSTGREPDIDMQLQLYGAIWGFTTFNSLNSFSNFHLAATWIPHSKLKELWKYRIGDLSTVRL